MTGHHVPRAVSRRHPLQRLESPSTGFSGVLHVVGLGVFYHAFRYLIDNPNIMSESFGWHAQYLTIIGLALSAIGFTLGLFADITSSHTLFRLKNCVLLVAAPVEVLVSILYWGLRAIDISLVVPPDLPILSMFDDLCFHFFPTLLLTLDVFLLSPPWPSRPVSQNASLIILCTSSAFAFLYWFWVELCYSKNGFYPYPIFDLLGTQARMGLFVLSSVLMWGVSAGLRAGYAWLNGLEQEIEEAIARGRVKEM